MAWLAVDEDGCEYIYQEKPYRRRTYWADNSRHIELPKGTIEKIICRKLTWDDEAVELKQNG